MKEQLEHHHNVDSLDTTEGHGSAAWSLERLNEHAIGVLVSELVPIEEERQGRPYGVHVIEGSSRYADIARYIELTVFDKFFGNDIRVMREEYEPYDEHSTFLVVLDYEKQEPAGVIRLIEPSEVGLKSLEDLTDSEGPWASKEHSIQSRLTELGDPSGQNTVDIGTMGVMPKYRSAHARTGVSAALYSTCVRWSLNEGYNHWLTIVDRRIYRMMQAWGEPFVHFEGCDWASYLDSKASLPVHTELTSGLERIKSYDMAVEAKTGSNSNIYGLYVNGDGLHDNFVLPRFYSVE